MEYELCSKIACVIQSIPDRAWVFEENKPNCVHTIYCTGVTSSVIELRREVFVINEHNFTTEKVPLVVTNCYISREGERFTIGKLDLSLDNGKSSDLFDQKLRSVIKYNRDLKRDKNIEKLKMLTKDW